MTGPMLKVRVRIPSVDGDASVIRTQRIPWYPNRTAAIVCDMWDKVDCVSAGRRAAALAPHIDRVLCALRGQGALIIHAPSTCMDFYDQAPGRKRASSAPFARAPLPFDWNAWDPAREKPLAMVVDDSEPCSCDYSSPRCVVNHDHPWTRQISTIRIVEPDAISDDGQEVFNLLTYHAIDLVLLMGVHANRCVLGRPFGIRQLVYLGQRPVLCRDLTDSYHREPGGHQAGTDRVVAHIERHWCPSVTSDQLVGGAPFRFDDSVAALKQ